MPATEGYTFHCYDHLSSTIVTFRRAMAIDGFGRNIFALYRLRRLQLSNFCTISTVQINSIVCGALLYLYNSSICSFMQSLSACIVRRDTTQVLLILFFIILFNERVLTRRASQVIHLPRSIAFDSKSTSACPSVTDHRPRTPHHVTSSNT